MSSTSRLLSNELKMFVVFRAEEGDLYHQILDRVEKKFSKQISFGTITKSLRKHREINDIKNQWRGGRP